MKLLFQLFFCFSFFQLYAQVDVANIQLSPFNNGFARVNENGTVYHIDSNGKKYYELDYFLYNAKFLVEEYQKEREKWPENLPKSAEVFRQDSGYGVMSPDLEILVPAIYDKIELAWGDFWKLYKNGKSAMYLPDGFKTPFFEEIGYLDGEYFDVMNEGKWQLYNKSQNKIVSRGNYEAFDYCGGCGQKANYVFAKKNGKWGVIDWNENTLIPFEFEHHHLNMRSDNWILSLFKNDQNPILNVKSQKQFDNGKILAGLLAHEKNGKWGLYDQDANQIFPYQYDDIKIPNENPFQTYRGDYLILIQNNRQGIGNKNGEIILPVTFDEVQIFGEYFAGKLKNETQLFNQNGELIFRRENIEIQPFEQRDNDNLLSQNQILKVKEKAYFGLFFPKTKRYIQPEFYDINYLHPNPFNENLILAEKNKLLTLLDEKGEILLENCSYINRLHNGLDYLIQFTQNKKSGIYDLKNRKELIPAQYNYLEIINAKNQKFIQASIEDKPDDPFSTFYQRHQFYTITGEKLTDFYSESEERISESALLLKIKGQQGYAILNLENKKLQHLDFEQIFTVNSEKLVLVSKNGRIGKLYNFLENKWLSGEYDTHWLANGFLPDQPTEQMVLLPFQSAMARIYNKDGFGYINEKGKQIVAPKFTYQAFDFQGDYAIICDFASEKQNTDFIKMGVIDRNGKFIFPMDYDFDRYNIFGENFYMLHASVKLSLLNKNEIRFGLGDLKTGKIILPFEYSQMQSIGNNRYILLEKNKKWGIADENGKIIVPALYDYIRLDYAVHYNHKAAEVELFPLLVSQDGKWRYLRKDGTYLPIVGNYAD